MHIDTEATLDEKDLNEAVSLWLKARGYEALGKVTWNATEFNISLHVTVKAQVPPAAVETPPSNDKEPDSGVPWTDAHPVPRRR